MRETEKLLTDGKLLDASQIASIFRRRAEGDEEREKAAPYIRNALLRVIIRAAINAMPHAALILRNAYCDAVLLRETLAHPSRRFGSAGSRTPEAEPKTLDRREDAAVWQRRPTIVSASVKSSLRNGFAIAC